MEIVLYQDVDLTKECDFDGYQRFRFKSEEHQKLVWAFQQNKKQVVYGYRIGDYSKKFNIPKTLEPRMKLTLVMDDNKRVKQFNK